MGIFKGNTTKEMLDIIKDVVANKRILNGEDKEEAYEIISSIYTAEWLQCALNGDMKSSGKYQWQVEKAHQTLVGCYNMQALKFENKARSEGKIGDEMVIRFEMAGPSDCKVDKGEKGIVHE